MRKNKRKNKKNQRKQYSLVPLSSYGNIENRALGFLDPHKYITLHYTELLTFNLATLTAVNSIWRLNSIFQPYISGPGTGHQPFGFDQLAALYNRYRVLKCRYHITYMPSTASYFMAASPTNGNLATAVTTAATYTTACEVPRAWSSVQASTAYATIHAKTISLNDIGGVIWTEFLADDRFEAAVGSNPAEVVPLNIAFYNPSGGTISISCQLKLAYEVDLHDPILVNGS